MPRRRHRKKHDPGVAAVETQTPENNLPYEIKKSETLGRYLVASEDLTAGTVIISEDALVVGPAQDTPPVCLGCYTPIEDLTSSYRCDKCQWPLCSQTCKGVGQRYGHSREECTTIDNCKIESDQLAHHLLYNAIVPLRCLLLKDHDPEKWKVLLTMEAHNYVRRKIPSIWDHNHKSVVDRIRTEWKISKFSEEEIHTVCGILEVNAFAVGDDSLNIRGLYPTAFLIAHSCVPNTSHTDDSEYHIKIFSSVPIPKEEIIVLSYTNTLQGTKERRKHLKQCKFFDCECARCRDPTELGTYLSGLKCEKCRSGIILAADPLNEESDWVCNNKRCHSTVSARDVDALLSRIGDEIKTGDHGNIQELEINIKHYKSILHKNHYFILGLKYSLSQLYGKSAEFLIHQMSETMLERKQLICEDILKVFDVLEPGLSHVRGLTLYELHAPLMILTIKRFEMQKISKVDLCRRLRKVVFYLQECCKIFQFDSKSSQEGCLQTAAENALVQLKSWEPVVGKLQN